MTGKSLENKIFDYIYNNLSEKRYKHTMCVCELAEKLAINYGEDLYNVQTAALLHDCAKCMSADESEIYISKRKVKIKYYDFLLLYARQVLHSYIAADIARNKFKITNLEILNAIRNHTVGRIGMSNCEKIIFVADSLSADRKCRNNAVGKNKLFKNLNDIFKVVLQSKINYVTSKFQILHPDIINIWNYYNR